MTYGEHAIDCLRSDLGFWRDVDDKWVIVYQGSTEGGGPLYLKVDKRCTMGWTASGIENCTLFDTYGAASAAAQRADYLQSPFALARIVKIKIKVDVQIDLLEDRPIEVLSALAEL